MRFLDTTTALLLAVSLLLSPVVSWLPQQQQHHRLLLQRSPCTTGTSTRLASTTPGEEIEIPDYEGKTIYQRSFYRLSPGSTVSKPNALVLEERLRFKPDPENPGYSLPFGPRTYIFRQGTQEDEITDEVYRINFGSTTHNGPGTMDTTIATILYVASNPELVQGDVLQLACEEGAAGLLGCIAARFASMDADAVAAAVAASKQKNRDYSIDDVMTVPNHEEVLFPPRMNDLTLSEEGEERLGAAHNAVRHFSKNGLVSLKDIRWSARIQGRRYDHYYRTIIGSDMDFSYPNSKDLARAVANYLLPSNPMAIASTKDGAASAAGRPSSSSSFGGIGMDLGETTTTTQQQQQQQQQPDPEHEVDPKIPPTFVHVCPDVRENVTYLRQALENGFRMTVNSGYLKLERLQFVLQALPEDAPEEEIEDLDLELKDESNRSYQSLTAIHHPNYAGDGTGEYFFPLETGEYESGSRSPYLEPEEGGSPW